MAGEQEGVSRRRSRRMAGMDGGRRGCGGDEQSFKMAETVGRPVASVQPSVAGAVS